MKYTSIVTFKSRVLEELWTAISWPLLTHIWSCKSTFLGQFVWTPRIFNLARLLQSSHVWKYMIPHLDTLWDVSPLLRHPMVIARRAVGTVGQARCPPAVTSWHLAQPVLQGGRADFEAAFHAEFSAIVAQGGISNTEAARLALQRLKQAHIKAS